LGGLTDEKIEKEPLLGTPWASFPKAFQALRLKTRNIPPKKVTWGQDEPPAVFMKAFLNHH